MRTGHIYMDCYDQASRILEKFSHESEMCYQNLRIRYHHYHRYDVALTRNSRTSEANTV